MMIWTRLAMASAIALVAFSPCLIPPSATPLRLIASLLGIGLLVKLYDLLREARLARHLSLGSYLAYLLDFFWLVLRREPGRQPRVHDIRLPGSRGPVALLSVMLCMRLFRMDWAGLPFALEVAHGVPLSCRSPAAEAAIDSVLLQGSRPHLVEL